MEQTLSPKQVAEALGASESSLKRWTDTGRLRATRTPGGHRRIAVREAVRFARESDVHIARPEVLGLPPRRRSRRRRGDAPDGAAELADESGQLLYDCLHSGDELGARSLVIQPYLDGHNVAAILDGPVRYAMQQLGELWHDTQAGVLIEHRATDIVLRALNQLRTLLGPEPANSRFDDQHLDEQADDHRGAGARAPIAVGGAPSGDPYLIPSLAAACVLADAGFDSINLGPDTPTSALIEAVSQYKPRLVWLSCSATGTRMPAADALYELADQFAAHRTALVIGGNRAEEMKTLRHPNVHFGGTMAELAAFAGGLRSH